MLGDQCQPETGADAVPPGATASEALEDACPFAASDARAGIVDRQSDAVGTMRLDLDRATTGVFASVLEQVGQDPFESSLSIRTVLGTLSSISTGTSPNP